MKVEMLCEEFKKAVDKAAVVVPKRSQTIILEKILIEAKDNTLYLNATDVDSFVTIKVPADVIEEGYVFVYNDDLKKLYNIKGLVTIETKIENENKISFSIYNDKKNIVVETANIERDMYPKINDGEKELFMDMRRNYLMETLKGLNLFLSDDSVNKQMTGYYFDGVKQRITALDGHRIGVRKLLPNDVKNLDKTATIPGVIFKHLKKIVDVKVSDNIKIYTKEKRVFFIGNDFDYSIKMIEGEYFEIDRMLGDLNENDRINFKTKEVKDNTAEYHKVNSSKAPQPMIIRCKDNNVYMGIDTGKIIMFDKYQTKYTREDIAYGFNPQFLNDTCKIITTDNMKMYIKVDDKGRSPIFISDYNDEWLFLILPINIIPNDPEEKVQKIARVDAAIQKIA